MKLYFYGVFLDVSNIDFFPLPPLIYQKFYPISHRYFTGNSTSYLLLAKSSYSNLGSNHKDHSKGAIQAWCTMLKTEAAWFKNPWPWKYPTHLWDHENHWKTHQQTPKHSNSSTTLKIHQVCLKHTKRRSVTCSVYSIHKLFQFVNYEAFSMDF